MEIINNASIFAGTLTFLAFVVNIIVQLTKEIVPLPTKLWCIIVAIAVDLSALFFFGAFNNIHCSTLMSIFAFFASFAVAYVAMYGFDTLKELWQRFKEGENINEDNKQIL